MSLFSRSSFLLLTLACTGEQSRSNAGSRAVPDVMTSEAPSIRGTITRKVQDRLRVEEEPLDSSGSPKASVRITAATRVVRSSGESAGRDDLRQGQRVSVWFDGPVQQSYPVQATAGAVRIESEDGAAGLFDIDGVIRYHELEGGFYAIQGKDGETYNPINLPEQFRQDGLPVAARLRFREEMMGIHQAGPLVEIVEIRKR
jgi:hypothetical protein